MQILTAGLDRVLTLNQGYSLKALINVLRPAEGNAGEGTYTRDIAREGDQVASCGVTVQVVLPTRCSRRRFTKRLTSKDAVIDDAGLAGKRRRENVCQRQIQVLVAVSLTGIEPLIRAQADGARRLKGVFIRITAEQIGIIAEAMVNSSRPPIRVLRRSATVVLRSI